MQYLQSLVSSSAFTKKAKRQHKIDVNKILHKLNIFLISQNNNISFNRILYLYNSKERKNIEKNIPFFYFFGVSVGSKDPA